MVEGAMNEFRDLYYPNARVTNSARERVLGLRMKDSGITVDTREREVVCCWDSMINPTEKLVSHLERTLSCKFEPIYLGCGDP